MTKSIPLAEPFDIHGKRVVEIKLREPRGGDYIKLGEPRLLVYSATGSGYYIEQPSVISAYFEKCITHELGADVIGLLSLEDAMAVKEALFGFFTDATARRSSKRVTH